MGLSELGVTFFKVGGHTHDGINSSKIDLSFYAEDDLAYINALIRRAIFQAGGFGNFPEGIRLGTGAGGVGGNPSDGVYVGTYTPPPTNLTLTTGVSQIEREIVYIDATWSAPDAATIPANSAALEYQVTLKKVADNSIRIQRVNTPQARFSPVDPGSSYQVTVVAINSIGVPSTTLGPVSITAAVDSVAPATPTGLAGNGALKTVMASWTENSEADVAKGRGCYDVQLALSSATFSTSTGLSSPLQTMRINGTLATFNNVASYTAYKVTVRAVDSSGNASNYASPVTISTAGFVPSDSDGTANLPWEQTWEQFSASDWNFFIGTSSNVAVVTGQGGHGGNILRATGDTAFAYKYNFAYDPNKTYKITYRVRQNTDPSSGTKGMYLGIEGVAADGTTLVSATGTNTHGGQHYFATAGASVAAGSTWTVYTAYFRGVSGSVTTQPYPDPNAPGPLYNTVRYFRPIIYVNYGSTGGGTADIDSISVEEVGFQVGGFNLATSSVTADKTSLVIGGANMIPNSSFEGPLSAGSYVTPDQWTAVNSGTFTNDPTTTGVISGTAFHGQQYLRLRPTASTWTSGAYFGYKTTNYITGFTAGQVVQLSCYVNLTLGTNIKFQMYMDWFNSAGSFVGSSAVDVAAGNSGFTRYTTQATVPAGGVKCSVFAIARSTGTSVTASDIKVDAMQLEFSDFVTAYAPAPTELVKDSVGTTQISDNAITSQKITANAIVAGKIAAGVITAAEIAANTITGDRIAAGTITTERLSVGSFGDSLIVNGDFEDVSQADATLPATWAFEGFTSGTIALSTSIVKSGARALRFNGTATSANLAITSARFPVEAGATYAHEMQYELEVTATSGFYYQVYYYDKGLGFLSNTFLLSNVGGTAGTWNLFQGTHPAPSNAAYALIRLVLSNPNVATAVNVDNIKVRKQLAGTNISNGAVVTAHMNANTINGDRISAGTLNADRILSNSITATQIAANAITTDRLLVTVGGTNNLLNNSSFESVIPGAGSNVDRWQRYQSAGTQLAASVVRSNTVTPQQGSYYGQVTNASGSTADVGVASYLVPVFANATYSFQIWIRAAATSRTCRAQINWYDADNLFISSSNGTNAASSTSAWTKFTVTGTAPASAVKCQVFGLALSALNAEVHYFDAAMLEMAGSPSSTWIPNPIELAPGTIMSDNIVAGMITGDKIAAGSISSGDAVFAAAAIVNSDIQSLSVDKLRAQTIAAETIVIGGTGASTTINGNQTVTSSTTTITVVSTTGFPSSGVVGVYVTIGNTFVGTFSYTGTTATTFTGVKPSGLESVTLASGWTVKGAGVGATGSRGIIQSASYSPGVDGWYIDHQGNVEFNNAVFRGNVYGSKITGTTITGGLFRTAVSGQRINIGGAVGAPTSNDITFYSGSPATEYLTGSVNVDYVGTGNDTYGRLNLYSPSHRSARDGAHINMKGATANTDVTSIDLIADRITFLDTTTGTVYAKMHQASSSLEILNGPLAMGTNRITGSYGSSSGAPGIQTRGGSNGITFDWVSTDLYVFIDSSQQFKILTGSNQIQIGGSAAKTFVIDHPDKPDYYLRHSAIEGPTNDVFYRGKEWVGGGGIVFVKLPDYFESLTHKENITIHLTAMGAGESYPKNLRATDVVDGGFYVEADSAGKFSWEVKAERKDIPQLEVESLKRNYVRKGSGPYTWLEKLAGV